ncbi:MAG: topology modulation protein, partial [Streptococcus sanguinis]|nr:topology modulation protein [Streptococcus sanguinis]
HTALARYNRIRQTFPQKFYELRNQKELNSFLQKLKTSEPL